MGLEISKRYSYYSFHLMSAKLYEDIGCHDGTQAVTFRGTLKFYHWDQWEYLKFGIYLENS